MRVLQPRVVSRSQGRSLCALFICKLRRESTTQLGRWASDSLQALSLGECSLTSCPKTVPSVISGTRSPRSGERLMRCYYYRFVVVIILLLLSLLLIIIIVVVIIIVIISLIILPSVVPRTGCCANPGLATRDCRSHLRFRAVSAFSSSPSVLG